MVEDGRRILSNVVSTQTAIHAPYGGVVPELASRHHVENLCPVVEKAMADAGLDFSDLDAVAVTHGPGLVGALLVGVQAAKAIALVHGKPLVPVHHIAGHIQAPFLDPRGRAPPRPRPRRLRRPHQPLRVPEEGTYRLLGRTRDDAAGEAFDKVAKLLGLGYPGGPVIDRLARGANDAAIEFTVARIKDGRGGLLVQRDQDRGALSRPTRGHLPGDRSRARSRRRARPGRLLPARGGDGARARPGARGRDPPPAEPSRSRAGSPPTRACGRRPPAPPNGSACPCSSPPSPSPRTTRP